MDMNRFPDNARVCFIGDSLVAQNFYLPMIIDSYNKLFPTSNVCFFNCGTAGGTVSFALECLEDDVLSRKPTHAVVAFGVNDSNRWVLDKPKSASRYEVLKRSFETYRISLETLCDRIMEAGIQLILCTPAPYDEYEPTPIPPLKGGYALMAEYAGVVRQLSREKNIPLCDVYAYLTEVMQTERLYTDDHVHPSEYGYSFMARCFLEYQGLFLDREGYDASVYERWRNKVGELRDVYAVECMIVKGYDMSVESKMAAVEKYVSDKGTLTPYFQRIIENYADNLDNKAAISAQADLIYEEDILPEKRMKHE